MEYCKTDLIAAKGCVFVKYAKASSALRALEEVAAKGMVSALWAMQRGCDVCCACGCWLPACASAARSCACVRMRVLHAT
jgi:hypothetical protein